MQVILEHMENFRDRVIFNVKQIPKGKVASYGYIAASSGSPRAARQVGGILRAIGVDAGVPWWRVINRDGYLSIKGSFEATKELQKSLLEQEGVVVSESYTIDMKKYGIGG
jgi:methylated-DNA-protein-cysteine methyltransferase related protein